MSPHHRDEDPDERAAGARGEVPEGEAHDGADDEVVDGPEDEDEDEDEDGGAQAASAPPDPGSSGQPGGSDPHDLMWQQIVDNYGEAPQWVDPPPRTHPGHPAGTGRRPSVTPTSPDPASEAEPHDGDDLQRGPEERFRPPPPPPLPWAKPPRLIAWCGLFGVPTLVLLALILGIALPPWLGVVLMFWFVGGFGYLVASMRPHGEDPDDGAVL